MFSQHKLAEKIESEAARVVRHKFLLGGSLLLVRLQQFVWEIQRSFVLFVFLLDADLGPAGLANGSEFVNHELRDTLGLLFQKVS